MQKGDQFYCQCPQCGSKDLTLFENFTVRDAYEIRDGKLVERISDPSPEATGQVYGECLKCPHRWRFRKNPIEKAYFANIMKED